MKLFKKAKKGFTLVELVVVIAVIAILSAVSVGAYFGITDSANNSRLEQEAAQMHTAIQAVALAPSDNHTLTKDGLTVKDVDVFEAAIEENVGSDIEVLKTDPTYIARPTIVLKTNAFVKTEAGAPVVYKTFEYYTHEIGGKKLVLDVVTGEFNHESSDVQINTNGADVTNSTIYFKAPSFSKWIKIHLGNTEEEVNSEDNTHTLMDQYAPSEDIYAYNVASTYSLVKFSWEKSESDNTREYTPVVSLPNAEDNTPYYNDGWKAAPVLTNAATNGKTVYFNDPTYTEKYVYAYKWNGDYNAAWPGEPMTAVEDREDGLASYTFSDDFYIVIFNNGNNGKQTANEYLADVDFVNAPYYDHENKVFAAIPEDSTPVPEETNRIYYANLNANITEENKLTIYAWNDEGSISAWPGVPMIEDSEVDNLYYYDLPVSYSDFKFSLSVDESNLTDNLSLDGYSETLCFWNGSAWAEKPTIIEAQEDVYSVVGKINDTAKWDTHDYVMTRNDAENRYEYLNLSLLANDEVKVRKNHSWADSWGNGGYNGGNIKIDATGNYNIYLSTVEENENAWTVSVELIECEHEWDATTGTCTKCSDPHDHTGLWDEDGVCTECYYACTHNFEGNVESCPTCGVDNPNYIPPACEHEWDADTGTCTKCSEPHDHGFTSDIEICPVCGFRNEDFVQTYKYRFEYTIEDWGTAGTAFMYWWGETNLGACAFSWSKNTTNMIRVDGTQTHYIEFDLVELLFCENVIFGFYEGDACKQSEDLAGSILPTEPGTYTVNWNSSNGWNGSKMKAANFSITKK